MADRRPKTLRDMALTVGVLAAVALVLYGMYGNVSLSPAGPSQGQTQSADITGGLQRAAPLVGFPVIVPGALPADWTASSFSFTDKAAATSTQPAAVRGGWLTPSGRFITVVQSDGPTADVLTAELGTAGRPTGTQAVDGTEWTVTDGRRSEAAWVRTDGDVTFLITGTASPEDFTTLARAVAAGTVAAS